MVNIKLFFSGLFLVLSVSLFAEEVSLQELLGAPDIYNEKELVVRGEVLDILPRPDGRWINIVNSGVSIGVWADRGIDIPQIGFYGSYTEQGDFIKVEGIFNSSCKQHLGQADIHAENIELVRTGRKIKEDIDLTDRHLVFFWGTIFLVLLLFMILKRSKERRGFKK